MPDNADNVHAALPAELLAGEQILALRRNGPGSFQLVGEAPEWFVRRGASGFPEESAFDVVAAFPYLEVFLPEAEAWWRGGESGRLRSGWWTQAAADGADLQLTATAARLPSGAFLLVRRLEADYDERQRLLQAARDLLLRHQQLMRETSQKEVLLHCIVHDLSGPLSGMLATLDILASENLSERGRRFLDVGRQTALRQSALIRDLLDVFSAEVHALEQFHTEPGFAPDIVGCAHGVMEALRPAFVRKGVELKMELAPAVPRQASVVGEQSKLERVFFNLLENALRHTPDGRAVTVRLSVEGASVRADVLDEGPGIAPELAGRLFEKLLKDRAGGGRAGLGLYFCRMAIEHWGGSIGCEARSGGGANFWFRLPKAG